MKTKVYALANYLVSAVNSGFGKSCNFNGYLWGVNGSMWKWTENPAVRLYCDSPTVQNVRK
jgi:hypothetical protein